jgi:scyllo-inositol 2-dehydrogenase (NADP+)
LPRQVHTIFDKDLHVTILVVGGGKMGLSHLAISSRIAGSSQVAICDTNWATRFLFRKLNFKAYASLDDALKSDSRIAGVIVATPTPSHYPIARTVLERSIPCFIEKPLTLDGARSRELVELAKTRNVYAHVGFVLRYVSTFSQLRDLVRSGELGAVRSYQARMNGNVITKSDNKSWRTDFAAGGGCLNEYGPHLIDLCRFIFGDVSELLRAEKGHVYSTRADDRIAFNWVHASGLAGDVKLDWCDATKRKSVLEFVIDFEHARVTADNSALRYSFHQSNPLSPEQQARLMALRMPPRVSFYLRGEEYTLQLEDFIGRCMNRKFRVDDEFGLKNCALLEDGLAVDLLIESISKKAGLL